MPQSSLSLPFSSKSKFKNPQSSIVNQTLQAATSNGLTTTRPIAREDSLTIDFSAILPKQPSRISLTEILRVNTVVLKNGIYSKSKQHPAWINKLFPIVFSLAGVGLLVFGWDNLSSGYSSKDWKTTPGIIIESRVVDNGRSKSGGRNQKPVIVYSYDVERDSFTSDRILFGIASEEWVTKYPEGTSVTVTYNPSEPSQSTLNTGAHMTAWIAPVMGMSFLVAGLFLFRSPGKQKSK
jgi:hypothetical protein